jgi:23S rRNA pseudouridine2605 synthase
MSKKKKSNEEVSGLTPDAGDAALTGETGAEELGAPDLAAGATPALAAGNEPEAEVFAEELAENLSEAASAVEPEPEESERPPAKLERLQKILAAAGVSSRRKAEELITEGRVQVNGKVVTALGTKADAGRDHIRVDGKLLQGAERLRYFVLNKPKGYVTTVKDPEGRPTVMKFFEKMKERLYPVGRLDYMSEGLLVMTNDGELANKLTKASSGVEKTYLVKVSGQPSEDEIERLRRGVAIDRGRAGEPGKPGADKVRTAPARIRQVRQGDNPWYEVVLIEGRNRELRKMFEEIGHFVEKIRRVGYGPLVLDQEPGHMREMEAEELAELRNAAEGKTRTPKSKELRRRNAIDAAALPTVRPKATRPASPASPYFESAPSSEPRPAKFFGKRPGKPFRPSGEGFRADAGPARPPFRRKETAGSFPPRPPRAEWKPRPEWKKESRPGRPPARFVAGPAGDRRPGPTPSDRPRSGPPSYGRAGRPASTRPYPARPAFKKAGSGGRPDFKPPASPRPDFRAAESDAPPKPFKLQIDPVEREDRPSQDRPFRPSTGRSFAGRLDTGRSNTGRSGGPRPGPGRPFRSESGLARPFTTSSGKPRAGGARPSNKSGTSRPSSAAPGRPFRRNPGEGSSDSRGTGDRNRENPRPERSSGPGWKPKTRYGPPKSASGRPARPGGFSKPPYKGKSSGPKRSAGKPGGKMRG